MATEQAKSEMEKALHYNQNATLQKKIAKKLCHFAKKELLEVKNILDIGCGTGFVGEEILKINPKARLYGLDKSSEKLAFGKTFYEKTFETTIEDFKFMQKYDLLISSMCLQWCKNLDEIIAKLRTNGKLFFAIPLPESLKEINLCFERENIKNPILSFQKPQLGELLHVEYFEEGFPSLLKSLKSFNNSGLKNEYFKIISHSEMKNLEKHFNGKITWKIGFYEL